MTLTDKTTRKKRERMKKIIPVFVVNYWNKPLVLKDFNVVKEKMYIVSNFIFCQNLLILGRL
ncbi:hypothetical protein J18TS1_10890 [Oceanobacillus oncorhynchi subsp. incaldanensis]|nr:hypothetical protein J18TS1_10890 [Oceanobacillus oncorhynchi subsp. incaldanensis]